MADTKITALTAITTVDPAVDVFPIVDVSDTTMAASGTTKKITSNQLLGAGGTATLASATITGDLTVATSSLKVTGGNTGFGTTSPLGKIDVRGTAYFNGTGASGGASQLIAAFGASGGSNFGQIINTGSTWSLGYGASYSSVGTSAVTWDSSGNLGLGVTPQAWDGNFKAMELGYPNFIAGNAGAYRIDVGVNGYFSGAGYKYAATGVAASYYSQSSGAHRWYNAPSGTAGNAITFTQAMTLDASGNLSIGATSVANQERLNLTSSRNVYVGRFFNSASSGGNYGFLINYSAAAPNNASNEFLACSDNAASRLFLYSNGGIANYQSNDSNLSDERTKTDIKPLASYWNKIKALEVVTFKYKDQTHSDNNIGLITQQVEAVAPELVDVDGFGNTPADGVPFKTIYTTDLYHGAIKALQEAMTRIEALEAKLA